MADNEIKILKTNTFEEWRQKSNEVSLNLGADDRLDSRLTDRVFKHDDVSGLKLNIIDGSADDGKTQQFQLIPDTYIDNINGYIILAHGTTIPSGFIKGSSLSQSGGFSAVIESVVTIDSKPKILIKSATGDFNSGQDLSVGGQSIGNADILRLIVESYPKAAVRVLNGSTELEQGCREQDYHIPVVSGKLTLAGSPDLSDFTEGTTIYQGDPSSPHTSTITDVEENATWYATIYHAGSGYIYVKNHVGTYSSSVQVKVLGFATTAAKLTAAQHSAFNALDVTVGNVVEFNKSLTTNDDIQVIATDLVTAINELQDDIGTVENLTTSATDLQSAINEHEADLFNAEGGDKRTLSDLKTADKTSILDAINEIYDDIHTTNSVTLGTNAKYLVGGINELESAVRGTNNNYTLGTDNNNLVSAVNELETALRGGNSDYTVTAGSNIRDGLNAVYADIHTAGSVTLNTDANFLVGGINELETAARGTNGDYNLSTSAGNFRDAINELYADIHSVNGVTLNTDANYLVGAINEIETALRGTNSDYAVNTGDNNFRDAIRTNQTEIGAVTWTGTGTTLATANPSNLTSALNALDAEIGDTDSYNDGTYGSTTIAGTLDLLQTGVINNDTDIGNLQKQIDGATTVDTARSWTGLAATNISSAIQEIADTTITAGAGLTGGGNLQSNKTINVVGATGGGITVNTNDIEVDSTVIRTTTTNGQTFNQNITFTTGNTLTIPSGATLDVDGTLLIGGGAGSSLSFNTAFVTLASSATQEGVEVDRSAININGSVGGAVAPTLDAKIQWNEGNVATKPERAWQWVGIDESNNQLTADLVSFYNAKDLIVDTAELDFTWNATDQHFSAVLKNTGVTAQQYGSATAIPVLTIDAKGRITAASTAAIVTELTVEADSGSNEVIALASETLDLEGTGNQITTTTGTNKVKFALPSDLRTPGTLRVLSTTQSTSSSTGALRVDGGVGIAKDVFIAGNLTVSGTTTQVNSNQVNIGDNIILLNSDETGAPSQNAGIEIERGTSANRSLIWNETTNTWQAQADNGTHYDIITEQTDYDYWTLAAEGVGGSENITTAETVTFNVGSGLTVGRNGSIIEYAHADTSTLSGLQGTASNGNAIQAFTVDGFGHVTNVNTVDFDNRYIRSWTAKDHDGTTYPITQGDELWFKEGSGMDVNFTADDVLTFTNTDRGSSQNIYKNVEVRDSASGLTFTETGTMSADTNNDTIIMVGGNKIDIDIDANSDALIIRHTDTSTLNGLQGGSGVSSVTVDDNGHVTAVGTATYDNYNHWKIAAEGVAGSNNVTTGETVTFNVGSGLTVARSGETIEYAHADTSSQASVDNSGNYVIQDVTLDGFGHVTGLASKEITRVNEADKIHVDEKNDNNNYQVLFTDGGTPTYERPYIDTDNAHFNYNPSTQLISGAKLHWDNINSKPTLDNYVSWTAHDHDGEGYTITSGDTLKFAEGSGMDVNFTADDVLTFTNTDRGSSQNILKSITVVSSDSGYTWVDTGTVTVNSNNFDLDFVESTGIDIDVDNTNKAIKFRNTAPNVTTNLSAHQSGNTVRVDSSDGTNATLAVATQSTAGPMSKEDKTKLDGLSAGGEPNQNAFDQIEYGTFSQGGESGTIVTASNTNDETGIMFEASAFDVSVSGDKSYVYLKDDQIGSIEQIGHASYMRLDMHPNQYYCDFKYGSTSTSVRITSSGQLLAEGNITAYSTSISSDEKLKDNIQVVDGALEKVSQLEGVTFEWKKDGRESAGVIAQNVEEVLPSAVSEKDDLQNEGETYKVVDYNQLSALFIESIKELKEENKLLRAEIEALKDINR